MLRNSKNPHSKGAFRRVPLHNTLCWGMLISYASPSKHVKFQFGGKREIFSTIVFDNNLFSRLSTGSS